MPLSHTCTDGATENRTIWTRFSATWGRIAPTLRARTAEQDFERFEGELHQIITAGA